MTNYNRKYYISTPFTQLYPLSKESITLITSGFECDPTKWESLTKEAIVYGINNVVCIFNRGTSVKKPTINKLCNLLKSRQYNDCKIVVSNASKSCNGTVDSFNLMNNCHFQLFRIKDIMTSSARATVPEMLGRYANKSMGDPSEKKQVISISVPAKGFPEIGYGGRLYASDIYKILKLKITPLVTGDGNNFFEAKGFEIVMEAFETVASMLGEGKTITSNKWNKIMEDKGVFDYLESE